MRCGGCGHTVTGRQWRTRRGYYCHYCPKRERAFVDERQLLEILWRDILDFLGHPDATLRALAHSAAESGNAEDRAERALMELATKLRELEEQEEQLLQLRLAKTISVAVLERKAKAIAGERERVRLRMEAVRQERAAAARAAEESATVRQLLGTLRSLAERAGQDEATRAEITRTVTKSVVVYTRSGHPRIHVTYAFGRGPVDSGLARTGSTKSSLGSFLRPLPSSLPPHWDIEIEDGAYAQRE